MQEYCNALIFRRRVQISGSSELALADPNRFTTSVGSA
jgi:predicted lipid carrier protein YhbT